MSDDCVFCRIAQGQIRSTAVRESERLIAIRDISPQAPTHILIIPKDHYSSILDCADRDLLGEMLEMAAALARELGVDEAGFRTTVNTNADGGQTVFHLHMHLLAGRPLSGKMG